MIDRLDQLPGVGSVTMTNLLATGDPEALAAERLIASGQSEHLAIDHLTRDELDITKRLRDAIVTSRLGQLSVEPDVLYDHLEVICTCEIRHHIDSTTYERFGERVGRTAVLLAYTGHDSMDIAPLKAGLDLGNPRRFLDLVGGFSNDHFLLHDRNKVWDTRGLSTDGYRSVVRIARERQTGLSDEFQSGSDGDGTATWLPGSEVAPFSDPHFFAWLGRMRMRDGVGLYGGDRVQAYTALHAIDEHRGGFSFQTDFRPAVVLRDTTGPNPFNIANIELHRGN